MYIDAETIRSQVVSLAETSRDVVMLLHFYGGAVGTEALWNLSKPQRAARGEQGGVVCLIYMGAFMLQVGESVAGASLPRPVPEPVEFDQATGTTFLCELPTELFYAELEMDRAKRMEALLVRQTGSAYTDTVTYPALAVHSLHLFAYTRG